MYLVENGGGGCYNALVCYYGWPGMVARLHPKSGRLRVHSAAANRDGPRRAPQLPHYGQGFVKGIHNWSQWAERILDTVLTRYIVALETESPSKDSRDYLSSLWSTNLRHSRTKKTKVGKLSATMYRVSTVIKYGTCILVRLHSEKKYSIFKVWSILRTHWLKLLKISRGVKTRMAKINRFREKAGQGNIYL